MGSIVMLTLLASLQRNLRCVVHDWSCEQTESHPETLHSWSNLSIVCDECFLGLIATQ